MRTGSFVAALVVVGLMVSACSPARGGQPVAAPAAPVPEAAPPKPVPSPQPQPPAPVQAPEAAAHPQVLLPPPQTPPAPIGPGPVFLLKVTDEQGDGAISDWNVEYIRRSLERAREQRAALFILQLTTDGGSVSIVSRMAEVISDAKDVRTVMYVKSRAFSAGALVALACDSIYMEPGSVIGAATPIFIMPGKGLTELPPKVEEKFMRATVTEFEAIAHKKGHSAVIAAAMVDPALEVLVVRRTSGGPLELMNRDEYNKCGTTLTGPGCQLIEVVNDDKKLLVFTDVEAVKWGLAKGSPANIDGLLKSEGAAGRQVVELAPTLSELMGRFFSSGWVISLLIAAAVFALYVELNHPSGVAAGFFLLALGLFFWAQFMAGTASALSIILVLAGAAFLAVEIFFFPGFGIPGIVGAVLVVLGLALARVPPDFFSAPGGAGMEPLPWGEMAAAVMPVFLGLILGFAGVAVLMRFYNRLPLFRKLVLTADLSGAVATAAHSAGVESPGQLVGLAGVAATTLRPGGTARFDGRLLDVISDGEFLEAGTAVKIVSADSNRIMVRRA